MRIQPSLQVLKTNSPGSSMGNCRPALSRRRRASQPVLRLPGDLSERSQRTPMRSMSAAMQTPFSASKMLESAGPGLTRPPHVTSLWIWTIRRAISTASSLQPSFGFPFQP